MDQQDTASSLKPDEEKLCTIKHEPGNKDDGADALIRYNFIIKQEEEEEKEENGEEKDEDLGAHMECLTPYETTDPINIAEDSLSDDGSDDYDVLDSEMITQTSNESDCEEQNAPGKTPYIHPLDIDEGNGGTYMVFGRRAVLDSPSTQNKEQSLEESFPTSGHQLGTKTRKSRTEHGQNKEQSLEESFPTPGHQLGTKTRRSRTEHGQNKDQSLEESFPTPGHQLGTKTRRSRTEHGQNKEQSLEDSFPTSGHQLGTKTRRSLRCKVSVKRIENEKGGNWYGSSDRSLRSGMQNTNYDSNQDRELSANNVTVNHTNIYQNMATLITSKVDYSCNICGQSFPKRCTMTVHMATHFEDGSDDKSSKFSCVNCSKQFAKRSELLIHKVDYMTGKPFKCEVCEKGFIQKPNLRMHIVTHFEDRPHKCNVCSKSFKRLYTLSEHLKGHYDNLLKCSLCPKRFFAEDQLAKHKAIHRGDKPTTFQCSQCGKEFTKRSNFTTHVKTHSTQKPFQCDICFRSFALEQYLRRHKAHANCGVKKTRVKSVSDVEKQAKQNSDVRKCNICGRRLRDIFHLERHKLAVHNGVQSRTYLCSICGKPFRTNKTLKVHMISHSEERPYQCGICLARFKMPLYLKRHKGIQKCRQTGKLVAIQKRIQLEDALQCNVCPQSFTEVEQLEKHTKEHEEKNKQERLIGTPQAMYNCDVCGKQFKEMKDMKVHRNIHRVDKPFGCHICHRKFTLIENLRNHRKTPCSPKDKFEASSVPKIGGEKVPSLKYGINIDKTEYVDNNENSASISEPYQSIQIENVRSLPTEDADQVDDHDDGFYAVDSKLSPCIQNKQVNALQTENVGTRADHGGRFSVVDVEKGPSFPNENVNKRILENADEHHGDGSSTADIEQSQSIQNKHLNRFQEEDSDEHHGDGSSTADIEQSQSIPNENGKRFKCDVCNKEFHRSKNLQLHKKIHTDGKPFQCENCLQTFSLAQYLRKHHVKYGSKCVPVPAQIQSTKDSKPRPRGHRESMNKLQCDECGKEFRSQRNLLVHKNTHSKSKGYECDVCFRSFTLLDNLKEHKNIHVNNSSQHQCDICHRLFSRPQDLTKHRQTACVLDRDVQNSAANSELSNMIQNENIKTFQAKIACALDYDDANLAIDRDISLPSQDEQTNMFKCDVCGKEFHRRKNLQLHKKIHVRGKKYQCETCLKLFLLPQYLKRHRKNICVLGQPSHKLRNVDVNTLVEKIECVIDNDGGNSTIRRELRSTCPSNSTNMLKCDVCGKEFHRRKNLLLHKKIHVKGKQYQCEKCLRLFSLPQYLKKHKSNNVCTRESMPTKKKQFECGTCLKHFTHENDLKKHKKANECGQLDESTGTIASSRAEQDSARLPFLCELCEKRFTTKEDLERHKRFHIESKSFYVCDVCGEGFGKRCIMTEHLSKHQENISSESNEFVCDTCNKHFTTYGSLRCHRVIHMEQAPFQCDICLKTFNKKSSLQSHLMTHYDDRPYKCTVCEKGFKRAYTLKEHIKVHCEDLHKCSYCPKQYIVKNDLEVHLKKHKENLLIRYQCRVCSKCFTKKSNLKTHEKIHSSEKPFKCETCSKSYAAKENFIRHLASNTCKGISKPGAMTVITE